MLSPPINHTGRVDKAYFLPGGSRVVTLMGDDGTVRIWDVGDDNSWSTADLILATEFLSGKRAEGGRLVPIEPARAQAAWQNVLAKHAPSFRTTEGPASEFYWEQAKNSAQIGDWEMAVHHLSRQLELPGFRDNPDLLVALSNALKHLNRLPEAEEQLKNAVASSPKKAEYFEALADVLYLQWKIEDSLKYWDEAIQLRGNAERVPGPAFISRGAAHAALGHWAYAARDYRLGLSRGGLAFDVPIYRWVATALLANDDTSAYATLRSNLLDRLRGTSNSAAASEIAHLSILAPAARGAESADILKLAERAVAAAPNDPAAGVNLAAASLRDGQASVAASRLREAIQSQDPGDAAELPRERAYLALAEYARGRAAEASGQYERAGAWLNRIRATKAAAGEVIRADWNLIEEVELILAEAHRVSLQERLPDLPADVFTRP